MLSNPMIGLALVFAVVASALFVGVASLSDRNSSADRDQVKAPKDTPKE